MVQTNLNLNMNNPEVVQLHAKQGDSGRLYKVNIKDATEENGTLRILRPDGVEVTADALKSADITPTESTDLVTFTALEEVPLTKLEVGLSSSQDLHGQTSPYPSGGGKNKLGQPYASASPKDSNGILWTVNDDGSITISGTATATSIFFLKTYAQQNITLSSGTYTFSVKNCPDALNFAAQFNDGTDKTMNKANPTVTFTNSATLTDSSHNVYLYVNAGGAISGSVTVYPQIEQNSTATDWSPYSNICPIVPSNGNDYAITVFQGRNNIYDSSGTTNQSGTTTILAKDSIRVQGASTTSYPASKQNLSVYPLVNGKTYLVCAYAKIANGKARLALRNGSNTVVASSGTATEESGELYFTFTYDSTEMANYYLSFFGNSGASYGDVTYTDIKLCEDGTTHSISLGRSVYGGTLDVVSGMLTVDRKYKRYTGETSENWNYSSWTSTNTAVFYSNVSLSDGKSVSENYNCITVCNQLPIGTYTSLRDDDTPAIAITGGTQILPSVRIPKSVLSTVDVTGFRSYLTNNPLDIVYELATPIVIDLTPQQISTLLGTNNIFGQTIREVAFEYDGVLAELPSEATEVVGRCIGDVLFTNVSSMPFTLNVIPNNQEETP